MSRSSALPPIGFIGGGKMATALIRGLLRAGLVEAHAIAVGEPSAQARAALSQAANVSVSADNQQPLRHGQIIVLAVKPQDIPGVLQELRQGLRPDQLVVSLAAGIRLEQLEGALGTQRTIRVMPNTPCLVGCGASCFARGRWATDHDASLIHTMLSAVGTVAEVPEPLLDAVTGLSGSGPAYVAIFIEALADGGVRMGLSRELALALAIQTTLGTARLLAETQLHPGQLKDMVASPGGTTIAGIHALERAGLRAAVMDAVEAATRQAAAASRLGPT
jgi:pyrroline-5-carboxylate reductase